MRTAVPAFLRTFPLLAVGCTSILGLPDVPEPPPDAQSVGSGTTTSRSSGTTYESMTTGIRAESSTSMTSFPGTRQTESSSPSHSASTTACATPEPIAFDATAGAFTAGSPTWSWSHTIGTGAANPVLFVSIASRTSASPSATLTSITFDGALLARVTGASPSDLQFDDLELWALSPAPTGSGSVVVTLSQAVEGASGASTSYSGVAPQTVEGTSTSYGMMGNPTIGWTNGDSTTWALGVAMEQGVSQFTPMTTQGQVQRGVATDGDWEAQSVLDQASVSPSADVTFHWTNVSGLEPWITLGASFAQACP